MKKHISSQDARAPLSVAMSVAVAVGAVTLFMSQDKAAIGSDPSSPETTTSVTPAATSSVKATSVAKTAPVASAAPARSEPSVAPITAASKATASAPAVFPYGGDQFTQFIRTSYANAPAGTPAFYTWMDSAYKRSHVRFKGLESATTLTGLLKSINTRYTATSDPQARANMEKQTGSFVWHLIKKTIPKFSLDHGFEFYNAIDRGQRQCYLQATLVSGMMQAAGMKAGVVMISRSDVGEESNNGHAVALVKLSDGTDCLVDVSDHHTPFVKQQRLMAADNVTGRYRYVVPQYSAQGAAITGYKAPENASETIKISEVTPLTMPYMASQFDFYRGERAPGGFTSAHKTEAGLATSAHFLQRAATEDPNNPLAVYALGRVSLRQGKHSDARQQIVTAYRLYDTYGFVPDGAREALALVGANPKMLAER